MEKVLVWVAVFCAAGWWFGHLYEQVALVPNMLQEATRQRHRWREFHKVTDRKWYFGPLVVVGLGALTWLSLRFWTVMMDPEERLLFWAFVCYGAALGVTAVLLATVNPALFEERGNLRDEDVRDSARWWLVANGVRLVLLGVSVVELIRLGLMLQRVPYFQ